MPKLTTLHRAEFPGENYATVMVLIEVEAGELVPRHTHPGLEIAYVLGGEAILSVDGRTDQKFTVGDWFEVPAGVPHSVQIGDKPARALST